MTFDFLNQPPHERQLYFEQGAIQRGLSPVVIEKDFWVCWQLGILFESNISEHLVFKGGTSLSKVFGILDRFSEDIDLSISPGWLHLPVPGSSRSQCDKWMKQAESVCATAVEDHIRPELESRAEQILGPGQPNWYEYQLDPRTGSPVLMFRYPTAQQTEFCYLARSVKLEFGSLTDQQPTEVYAIRPWLADTFPDVFADWECDVVALDVERSFWEKATILHAEHHRPATKTTPDRISRHYADTAALSVHPRASGAVARTDLMNRVVEWKSRFFRSSWATYDLARPGSFRLLPRAERVDSLRRDYHAMRDMYLTEPREFDEILSLLADLERRINAQGP